MSAREVLQKLLQDMFGDIEGCHVLADDLIIAGKDEADHDKVVRAVMKRATDNNVKLNPDKIQFKVPSLMYMGSIITDRGLRSDPGKVQAIVDYPHLKDKGDLCRFWGMVKYLDKFIAGESELSAPLRGLMKDGVPWEWHPEHDDAMQKTKDKLISAPTLSFYDVNKSVTI